MSFERKKLYQVLFKRLPRVYLLFFLHNYNALKIGALHCGIRAPVENTRACWGVSLSGRVSRLWLFVFIIWMLSPSIVLKSVLTLDQPYDHFGHDKMRGHLQL